MELRSFGATAFKVSPIGLGLAALGRPGYINLGHGDDLKHNYDEAFMEKHAHLLLDQAYQAGIRYFDAARSYGKAEQFLANWLNKSSKSDLVIGSKWGYTYTANWQVSAEKHEVKDHSIAVLSRQWPESVQLLKKRLNIYHIHSATLESGVLKNKAVLDELWRLKAQGVIIGFSTSGPHQSETIEQALTIKHGNELLFGSVQATWNMLEQSATDALKKAHELGLGVIIKEAVANGRLSPRNSKGNFNQLDQYLKAYTIGLDALAIAFVLQQPWVSTVLSGAAAPSHLQSNVKGLSVSLDDKVLAIISQYREKPELYWKTRSSLTWN